MNVRRAVALILLCTFAAACGGGSDRMSRSEYRARLTALANEANRAQGHAQRALNAKTVAGLQSNLRAYADAEDRIGDEVEKLNPPKDAEAANAQLAKGEHDTASELRAVLPTLSKFPTPAAAMQSLSSLGNANGGHEIDRAIAKLKKLGYTKGS